MTVYYNNALVIHLCIYIYNVSLSTCGNIMCTVQCAFKILVIINLPFHESLWRGRLSTRTTPFQRYLFNRNDNPVLDYSM